MPSSIGWSLFCVIETWGWLSALSLLWLAHEADRAIEMED